ncbi:hypothetical protein CPC08DRAFT_765432 [Agrocybe pediades]|nr:hypothetical protein CPC08DRAFT_765432 [Agrocybe pediades]
MSAVKLNLQPPPNVDFVIGYPGVPPGPDRPQATVKGAIEVRVPPQGVKAKWVQIELRKVETLPGGGPANTFYDSVGISPVILWSSSDEYTVLRSQDFPFFIRIPESTPPTLTLDNRAGIGYELVASVCTKGKKGFLRRAKAVVVSTTAPIIIDKHDLHSTWPVYCQNETRSITEDGVSLIVERNRQCYGPGDRVSVTATVKSDNMHTVVLRGFEIFVQETIEYKGLHTAAKKSSSEVKVSDIAKDKVSANTTLYGGSAHTAEVSCMISPSHTTTTVSFGRHIDITYILRIKALLGSGTPVIMDLPVVISNWQRQVSFEAINRIGPAPALSLLPPPGTSAITRVDPIRPTGAAASATLPIGRTSAEAYNHGRNNSGGAGGGGAFNTIPGSAALNGSFPADEFGASSRPTTGNVAAAASSSIPTISTGTTAANRFQPKNVQSQEDLYESSRQRGAQGAGSGSGSGSASAAATSASAQQWETAEEEKLRLFEEARKKVLKVQGPAAAPPPATLRSSPPPQNTSPGRGAAAPSSPGLAKNDWPSPEEEKRRFQQALEAVQRTQGGAQQAAPLSHTRDTSDPPKPMSSSGSGSGQKSNAARLYEEAIKAQQSKASASSGSNAHALPPPKPQASSNAHLTAEQEKEMLRRRYEEAKRAVERTQNGGAAPEVSSPPPENSAPIAYDSLYPAPPPPADSPPPFNPAAAASGPSNIMAHLSEKERLRRKYEEEDAAAARKNATPPPPAAYTSPPPPPAATPVAPPAGPGPLPNQYANALEEKEALRRKFEARDAARAAPTTPQAPARANTANVTPSKQETPTPPARSPSANVPGSRPAPTPPANGRVLTALEEKALLKAKYEARDSGARKKPNGNHPPSNGVTPVATPPPLAPRPPADYIKATQEEDARLSRLNGVTPNLDLEYSSSSSSSAAQPPSGAMALDIKPFTPFQAGFDSSSTAPPLPLSRPHGD